LHSREPEGPTGDIRDLIPIWKASLRAQNRSPRTIRSYGETVRLLADFLDSHGFSITVSVLEQEHVELFISDHLERWRPGTAAVRYRSLKALFKWLGDRGLVSSSPMANMKAPRIPDRPVPVVGTRISGLCSKPVKVASSKMPETEPSFAS
jgi:site-specific recombinase XerD